MEMFEAIRKKYGSRDWGGRIVYGDYKYCFQPLKFELADDGRYYYSEPMADEEWKDLEIVARGILADYIKTSDEKQIKQIFEDYYTECLKTYKDNKQRKHDINIMLKSESEIEALFIETMLEEEAWRIEVSMKKLEKYITDDERTVLQKVGDGFMEYLRNRLQELNPDTPTESPSEKEEAKSRTIKESELGKCFNAKFKGAGNNHNYFNNLVADLKDLTTKNDCSAVALMIWESKTGFINLFSTFAKWCRFFFDCIGVEVNPNFNYSRKVQASEQLKKKYYYL